LIGDSLAHCSHANQIRFRHRKIFRDVIRDNAQPLGVIQPVNNGCSNGQFFRFKTKHQSVFGFLEKSAYPAVSLEFLRQMRSYQESQERPCTINLLRRDIFGRH
jgi:hypothetical protein